MFFDDPTKIPEIAAKTGCSVFCLPDHIEVNLKNALILQPDEKSTITIDRVRQITEHLNNKQTTKQFVLIRPADALSDGAANALLKNLEEPKPNYHFILVTKYPSRLLSTILSRSAIYILKVHNPLDGEVLATTKTKDLAKKLIVATPRDLPPLADEITKKKDGTRDFALEIVSTSIEILYKSYFKTKNPAFLKKIPKFITLYESIQKNGHLKLHLVADLL